MLSWPAPHVPTLATRGTVPLIHDTVTGRPRHSAQGRPGVPGGSAGLYVCGITPYDATHLGHASTYLAFDLLVRAWRDAGLTVCYVQNVTDVDDPLLERAAATGQDWRELAEQQIELFRSDMKALALIPPNAYVGAVETIPDVVAAVEDLERSGRAYRLEADGGGADLYADLAADDEFGSFAHLAEAQMAALFAERGGDPDRAGKRNRLDPLLWRAARESEPSWPGGSLGAGRPGWHIECAVIARDRLMGPFSVLGGGEDLIFPHHEMSVSHARMLGAETPRIAMHTGLLGYEGEKMSKSRGNLVFVSELLRAGWSGPEIRLALLDHHYRESVEWRSESLPAARERHAAWFKACSLPSGPPAAPVVQAIRDALGRDLDSPAALAAVDEWAARARSGEAAEPSSGDLVAQACGALLGVTL